MKIHLNEEDQEVFDEILAGHESERAAVLPVLQDINARCGYLPPDILRHTAHYLDIPLSQIHGMATFYNAFSLTPRGKYTISVCMGTACYVKGAQRILEAFERELKIQAGETTEDLLFSLETVNCIGCCGQSPVVTINDDIEGYVKQAQVPKILQHYH
ncbi:MAG: NADH-quinone oxidoreductase subunit E [Planctomycetes bacterium B3_Pla]|nr:MAG: NADH-quinone oxidoreductase subunit E [Planctomycetes bacterium B3_Pla]